MATSSKVQFALATLKEKALESIDFRIKQQQDIVASYDDDSVLEQRVTEWRLEQEARLSELFRSLGDIPHKQLASFKIANMPEVSTHERARAEGDLRRLESLRSQIVAKAESLVPDENGNVSLTKTQLQEFFAL